jgi:dolichyl-phosphate-mannose-protein mannosyltransferase
MLIAALFTVALVPRLLILAFAGDSVQAWEYETLAQNVANGHGYVINHLGHPTLAFGDGNLYSFFAGALYASFGHYPVLLAAVQAILASLAAPVLFVIAERPFGAARAAFGAALAALHPGLLAYTVKLHPLGLDVLLLALIVCWSLRRGWSWQGGIMAGLTLGLGVMSRPTYFVAGLAAFTVRWVTHRVDRRYIVAAVALALLVPMPWIARNWLALGQPLLVSTSLEDVWKGNNELASGSGFIKPSVTAFDVAPDTMRDRIMAADELGANSIFAEQIVAFVQHQPDVFVGLVARKFFYFWWLPQQAGALYPAAWLAGYQLYALLVLGFAAIGAVGIVRAGAPDERNLVVTLLAVAVALASVHALAYVDGRHRWTIEPLLLLISARGAFSAAAWTGERLLPQSRLLRRLSER